MGAASVVINISSDAAVNPYAGWGAYGASKAALRHLTAIWAEEAKADGVSFLSIDPGDMDTPLHALAVPDADPRTLKRPEDSAAEIIKAMLAALPSHDARQSHGTSMIAADQPDRRSAKLVIVDAAWRDATPAARRAIGSLFSPGDLVVANDAATLPASLHGSHCASGEPIEVRLAAWVSVGDPTQFVAIAFGAGDYRTRTEDRPPPPPLSPGDRLSLGPLVAVDRAASRPSPLVSDCAS